MPVPVRFVYARPRTFIAIAIGLMAFFLLPGSLRLVTRLLVGWDVFVAFYLVLVFTMVLRSGIAHIRRNAALQDDGRFLILMVTAARRLRQHRRHRLRTRRLQPQRAGIDRWRP